MTTGVKVLTDYLEKKKIPWDYYADLEIIKDYFYGNTYDEVVVFKFENIEVTNSRNNKTILHDMYIAAAFKNGDFRGILGKQFTFTKAQFSSGYCFSHLQSSINQKGFSGFCFGIGYMGPLLIKLKVITKEAQAALLIQSIYKYLSWESLEGGPYRKMSTIREYSNSRVFPKHIDILNHRLKELIVYLIDFELINIVKKDNEYVIDIKPFSEDERLQINAIRASDPLVVVKGNDGIYYYQGRATGMELKPVTFPFRGEVVTQQIIEEKEINTGTKFYLNPNIYSHVNEFIQRNLKKTNGGYIRTKKEINIIRKMPKADRVSMPEVPC